MRVFVTGATGVLGHRLVERLSDRGHTVVGLARDAEGAAVVKARGGILRRGDVLQRESLEKAIDDVDVVIHAATSLPTAMKPSDEDWAQNDEVRLDGARNLVAIAGNSIEQFLFPSVIWVVRQPDGSTIDEESECHPDRATQSVADVEDYLSDAGATYGFDVTVLRYGLFYAPDGVYTRQFGQNLLAGKMPIIGGGLIGRRDARLSVLHADDAAQAFAEAIDTSVSGMYHVVDDERVTAAEYFAAFADQLDATEPNRVPGWLARFIIGKESVNLFTKSIPTTNERFRRDTGWEPMYPTYREVLTQIVETWKNDGTLRKTKEGYEWNGN